MVQGRKRLDPEVSGLLYREKFGLSWQEFEQEPADQVGLWLALEQERNKEEQRRSKQHN